MDEAKEKKQRKIIWGIIGVLCVMAMGLGIVIGIKTVEDSGHIAGGGAGDGQNELSEREELYLYFNEDMENLSLEVDEILAQNPKDGKAAEKIYTDYINKYISYGLNDYASYCAEEGAEKLLAEGLKQEALELFLLADLEYFMNSGKCRLIYNVIDLAKELGEEKILLEYRRLAATTDGGFGETCDVSNMAVSLNDLVVRKEVKI